MKRFNEIPKIWTWAEPVLNVNVDDTFSGQGTAISTLNHLATIPRAKFVVLRHVSIETCILTDFVCEMCVLLT